MLGPCVRSILKDEVQIALLGVTLCLAFRWGVSDVCVGYVVCLFVFVDEGIACWGCVVTLVPQGVSELCVACEP